MLKRLIYCLLFALLPSMLWSGTTGKIIGRVIDKKTGEPLVAVNVIIKGLQMGAATDEDGFYMILNVPPGVYTLQAIYVGYSVKEVTDVLVKADLTTEVNFELTEAAYEGETVVVVAERALIQKDATATAAVVSAQEIEYSPIESFVEIAQTKAGVNIGPDGRLHFRGGRSEEVAYFIDGIPVTDAIGGGISLDIPTNAIEELSLITGAFSAEYGQAMSGVVNIITKEGGSDFSGRVSFQTGDIVTRPEHAKYFLDEIKKIDVFNTNETEFNLSGPIWGDRVTFNVSGRIFNDAGYLYGVREHGLRDIADSVKTGDGKVISLNSQRKYNFQGKIKFRLTNTINFYLTSIYENLKYQVYNHRRSKVPDGIPWRYRTGIQFIAKLTHQFRPNAFYSLVLGYLNKDYKRYLDEDINSPKYVWNGYSTGQYFYPGGSDNFRHFNTQKQYTTKFDLTIQLFQNHEVKTGFEFKKLDLFNHSYYLHVDRRAEPFVDENGNGQYDPGEPFEDIDRNGVWNDARDDNGDGIPGNVIELEGYTNDRWHRFPTEFAWYIQDKVELKDMVINIGLRLDYFDPDGRVLSDPTDPDITRPIKNENIWKDWGTDGKPNTNDPDGTENNGIWDPGEPPVTLEERMTYWYKKVDPTIQLSPRIAFAFPISANGKLFFSYGHFFQLPPYQYLYQDYDNQVKPGLIATIMGNPGLKPQKTISYEVGIEQQFGYGIAAYLKLYQKDLRNILGTDIIVLPNTDAYGIYVNRDYGRVRGINFSLVKQFSNFFSASIDYTYQIAEGNESNPKSPRSLLLARPHEKSRSSNKHRSFGLGSNTYVED
ncbi:MAG: TonB-dependent receptor [Calditrichaeota bacterium]|nr:TonB-dependent receptor [Calditrichota bacterium]